MGGKSSTQKVVTELPESLEAGAAGTLGAALQSASLPYSPNRGVTIAGVAPQQEAAMQGSNMMASALGLPIGDTQGYLPQTETGAGGFQGYSTGGLYDQTVNRSVTPEAQIARENVLKNYGLIGTNILGEQFPDMEPQLRPVNAYGAGGK